MLPETGNASIFHKRNPRTPQFAIFRQDCEKPFAEGVVRETAVFQPRTRRTRGTGKLHTGQEKKTGINRKGGCMMEKEIIKLKDIAVSFDGEPVLSGLNLSIRDGEFVTLLGPSGCGKSTTLNLICGLEKPDGGKVFFGDQDVTKLAPEKRGVGMVFQNYALYPHLTVRKNILFPMENLKGKEKLSKEEMNRRADEAAKLVQITELMDRKPGELSGGQQQRVAIARALVTKPAILLADEPTGNLDSKTSQDVLGLLKVSGQKFSQTIVMITHNEEIAQLADRIVRIEDGRIVYGGKGGRTQ